MSKYYKLTNEELQNVEIMQKDITQIEKYKEMIYRVTHIWIKIFLIIQMAKILLLLLFKIKFTEDCEISFY